MSKPTFTIISAEPGWQRVVGAYDDEEAEAFIYLPAVPVIAWAISTGADDYQAVGIAAGESLASALDELDDCVWAAYIAPATGAYIEGGVVYESEESWLKHVADRGRFRERQRQIRAQKAAEAAAEKAKQG